jgi:hypothetical protein
MGEFKLIQEITSLSESDSWNIAKSEWVLNEIFFSENPDTCLCGHYPIKELCEIKNRLNNKLVVVGNCCVKKFIGLPSDNIFQGLKRVMKDYSKSLNIDAIEIALYKDWINDWEYKFYVDTFRRRKLSEKQLIKRTQINEKVIRMIKLKK